MLAFTPGEPAGIGPDLAVMIAQRPESNQLVAFTDPELLQRRATRLGLPLKILDPNSTRPFTAGQLRVEPIKLGATTKAGELNPLNSPFVLNTIGSAVTAIQRGQYRALVTGPIHKGIINRAGTPFSGHTEFLAELTQTRKVVMMLTTPCRADSRQELRVALATTHLPLQEVAGAITRELLVEVIEILYQSLLNRYGIKRPAITVCALNPHAGEEGYLGSEEIEIIQPVIEQFRAKGIELMGAVPADSAFTKSWLAKSDAILAMYHDQGLPVLKHLGFGKAVNLTLGLPFIRSSVDHGTALDLAGTGRSDPGSLLQAVNTARQLCSMGSN